MKDAIEQFYMTDTCIHLVNPEMEKHKQEGEALREAFERGDFGRMHMPTMERKPTRDRSNLSFLLGWLLG